MDAAGTEIERNHFPRFQLKQIMLAVAVICFALAFLSRPLIQSLNNANHRKWSRMSPFTDVQVEGDKVTVEVGNADYQLVSINGATTSQILKAADRNFGNGWGTKRFVEDLPAVLGAMGKLEIDEQTVSLVLQDTAGEQLDMPDVPMTFANRSEVYRKSRNKTPGVPSSDSTRYIVWAGVLLCLYWLSKDVPRFLAGWRSPRETTS